MTAVSGAKSLRFFFVVMVMFGITTTLHGLSPLATYGLGSVFFLLLAVVAFLIPAGMVATELAMTWQRDGGLARRYDCSRCRSRRVRGCVRGTGARVEHLIRSRRIRP